MVNADNKMSDKLQQAAQVLHQGGVVAYPTEAVYGLGCDPENIKAIQHLLQIKRREKEKGLILVASTFSQLEPYLGDLPENKKHPVLASWPGPFTWLWPAKPDVSEWLRGKHDSIAVRVTAHPVANKLCELFGSAIVSTSANPAGLTPAHSAAEVKAMFGEQVDYILKGNIGPQKNPTEIRDASNGKLVRN